MRRICALLAALVVFGTLAATASASVESKRVNQSRADVVSYWTPERMRDAKPAERRLEGKPAAGKGSGGGKKPTAGAAKEVLTAYTAFPTSTNGKVFFSDGGLNYVCSGTALTSNNESVVWTAGHCVNEGPGKYYTNWAFVPSYKDNKRPYGTFAATSCSPRRSGAAAATSRTTSARPWSRSLRRLRLTDTVGGRSPAFDGTRVAAVQRVRLPRREPVQRPAAVVLRLGPVHERRRHEPADDGHPVQHDGRLERRRLGGPHGRPRLLGELVHYGSLRNVMFGPYQARRRAAALQHRAGLRARQLSGASLRGLRPAPGAVAEPDAPLAFTLRSPGEDEIDTSGVSVVVDGSDVTGACEVRRPHTWPADRADYVYRPPRWVGARAARGHRRVAGADSRTELGVRGSLSFGKGVDVRARASDAYRPCPFARPACPVALAASVVALFACAVPSASAQSSKPPTTPELIEKAADDGKISRRQERLTLANALARPSRVPPGLRSDEPWDGTLTLLRLREELASMPEGTARDELAEALAATSCSNSSGALPNLDNTSPNFRIEYGTIGGGLSIGAYRASLDTSWNTEIGTFGWAKPPLDTTIGKYPVRIDSLGSRPVRLRLAERHYAGLAGNNPNTPWNEGDAYKTCMVLNSDYEPFPGTAQQALDATTAHEFNHSIQFGYGALSGTNAPDDVFVEGGATWMEDEVFDNSNDNYNYLWPDFAEGMGDYDASSPYPYWITFRGLTERFGTGNAGGGEQVMQDFWEDISENAATGQLDAFEAAFTPRGTTLAAAFHAYAIAIRFKRDCDTPGYAYPYCFEEGSAYTKALPSASTVPAGRQRHREGRGRLWPRLARAADRHGAVPGHDHEPRQRRRQAPRQRRLRHRLGPDGLRASSGGHSRPVVDPCELQPRRLHGRPLRRGHEREQDHLQPDELGRPHLLDRRRHSGRADHEAADRLAVRNRQRHRDEQPGRHQLRQRLHAGLHDRHGSRAHRRRGRRLHLLRLERRVLGNGRHVHGHDERRAQRHGVVRGEPAAADEELTVSLSGTGSGTVTSDPAGINCGSDCDAGLHDRAPKSCSPPPRPPARPSPAGAARARGRPSRARSR